MRDRRGPVGRAGRLASGIAAAARRRQRARDPRVVVYDAAGHGRVLGAGEAAYERLLETGAALIALGAET